MLSVELLDVFRTACSAEARHGIVNFVEHKLTSENLGTKN